jgi:dihydrolipoamide dehydrogenase
MDFDLVIIGCGSAGIEAAKTALNYTKKVLCIEKTPEDIGGTCLNRGCVPTKHLREGVYLFEKLRKGNLYGLSAEGTLNIRDAIEGADKNVIFPIRESTYKFLRSKGVKFAFTDRVYFLDRNTLRVGDKTVTSKFFLIATGSRPGSVPNVVPDGEFILDTDSFWKIKETPKRVLIVGGGVSGVEFAHILKGYGTEEVYIVELEKEILPSVKNLSPDVVRRLRKDLERKGYRYPNNHAG